MRLTQHALFPARPPLQPRRRAGLAPRADAALSPPFTLVKRTPAYELRLYKSYTVAAVAYDTRPEGLARLAAYFDGSNAAEARIPATSPLTMRYAPAPGGLAKRMELFVPPVPGALPPAPSDGSVVLEAAGGELLASLSVPGSVTPEVAAAARARLAAALAADGLRVSDEEGAFRVAQFGPLFSLAERRNEVLLAVALGKA